jgi:hypothetical protein
MEGRTVRELSGEIWAEVTQHYLRENRQLKIEDLNTITDLILGVLARHVGKSIKNDEDFPVEPLDVKRYTS